MNLRVLLLTVLSMSLLVPATAEVVDYLEVMEVPETASPIFSILPSGPVKVTFKRPDFIEQADAIEALGLTNRYRALGVETDKIETPRGRLVVQWVASSVSCGVKDVCRLVVYLEGPGGQTTRIYDKQLPSRPYHLEIAPDGSAMLLGDRLVPLV